MDYYSKYKYYKKKYKSYKNSIGGTIECIQDGNKYKIEGSKYSTPEAQAINILWKGNDNKTIYTGLCSDNKKKANFIHYRSKDSRKLTYFGIDLEKWWGSPNNRIDSSIKGYFEKNNIVSDSPLRHCPKYYFLKLCPYQREKVIKNLTDSIRQRQVSGKVEGAEGADKDTLFQLNLSNTYHGDFYDKALIKSIKVFNKVNIHEDDVSPCCYKQNKSHTKENEKHSCFIDGGPSIDTSSYKLMDTKAIKTSPKTDQSIIDIFYEDIVELIWENIKDQEEIDYRTVKKQDILKAFKTKFKHEDNVNSIKSRDIQTIINNLESGNR